MILMIVVIETIITKEKVSRREETIGVVEEIMRKQQVEEEVQERSLLTRREIAKIVAVAVTVVQQGKTKIKEVEEAKMIEEVIVISKNSSNNLPSSRPEVAVELGIKISHEDRRISIKIDNSHKARTTKTTVDRVLLLIRSKHRNLRR